MKLIALTVALALGGAAYAQDMSTQAPPPPPAADQTAPADPAAPPPPAPAPTQGDMSATGGAPMAGGAPTETKGGYMPSTPPLSGTPQPGATVRVQPSMSPSQAFPPPAPKTEYPVCKKGQTDGCRNRGGK
jgi:hypothetical protein